MKYILAFLILVTAGFTSKSAFCQIDRGGIPRSFQHEQLQKSKLSSIDIPSPDRLVLQKEDTEDANLEKPYRVGIEVPVDISPATSGQWENLPEGGKIWRASISCLDAQGIGLNYNELQLPEGSDIFVYTPDHTEIIGAITETEVPLPLFSTRPLKGSILIIEYYQPADTKVQPVINISGLVYMYRGFSDLANTTSEVATGCEVNVNCVEGQNWQKQKQGVVKILTKVGTGTFYCSGVVVNNTLQDFSGLMLTAGHCSEGNGKYSSDDDYTHWIFYFNYEYAGCSSSGTLTQLTVVGVQKLATSSNLADVGSDFLLVKSLQNIPAKYNAFYCGWDAGTGNSSSGVCMHHPNGDPKKISTYVTPLGSSTWGSTPNTHWQVRWAQTVNGWGVTEGGSSGSPLFDDEGLVIGTLTGGPSSCDNKTGEDLFGKIPYSWLSNGTLPSEQLKPWLDPGNTGILKMPGSFNQNLTIADFSANTFVTPVGGTIDFQDLSSGKPNKWHWYFQGGTPYESTEQNPSGILFDTYGKKNVKLVVSNSYNTDSIVKESFIDVRAVVSPNPCKGMVSILTDVSNPNGITIEVFDAVGKIAQRFDYAGSSSSTYTITLPDYGNVFIIRIIQGNQVQTHKVIVVH